MGLPRDTKQGSKWAKGRWGEGNPAVDSVLKTGLLDLGTGVCMAGHTEWHTQNRPWAGLLWQLLQPGPQLFPLILDSIRYSEKAWRKSARTEGSRENAIFSCGGIHKLGGRS